MKIKIFGMRLSLSDALKEMRRASGLTSEEFEHKLKDTGLVSAAQAENFAAYEQGEKTPSLKSFCALMEAADFDVMVVDRG